MFWERQYRGRDGGLMFWDRQYWGCSGGRLFSNCQTSVPRPSFKKKSIWCCCAMSPETSRSETPLESRHFQKNKIKMEPQPSSKTQGCQTYKNNVFVRTPLSRHTTIIAHEFSPNKSQRRLQHLEVWPPSKGLCLPSEPPQPAREEEGACVWH
jgi:hypothetical protein